MSILTEKDNLQVTFSKEKLEALRFYMQEKDLTVEGELQNYMQSIYGKYVPTPTRRYLERNDNEQEEQSAVDVNIGESTTENTAKVSSPRGRKKSEKLQSVSEKPIVGTVDKRLQEELKEKAEEENQGMTMSM